MGILSHTPQGTIILEEKGVIFPGSCRDHSTPNYFNRSQAISGGAVAELARGVCPHRPQGPVGLDKETVITTGGNGNHIAGNDLIRGCVVVG